MDNIMKNMKISNMKNQIFVIGKFFAKCMYMYASCPYQKQ